MDFDDLKAKGSGLGTAAVTVFDKSVGMCIFIMCIIYTNIYVYTLYYVYIYIYVCTAAVTVVDKLVGMYIFMCI
jgi:hypothetical protein